MKKHVHNSLEGDRPELTIALHDGTEEQVTIVIVHRDRPEYLNILLQSIAVTSINNNYEMIVVDNNSGKESQDFLDDIQDEVKVIRNKENLYWGKAASIGAEAASKRSKYIIFMHCDVVITNPGWIDLLINVAETQQSGMVGVELGQYYMQSQKIDFIQEWCLLMSKDCWNAIGPWPETLPQVGHSFVMTVKAQSKGFKPQVMRNPICHHYRIFSLDVNEFEVFIEKAQAEVPRLMREMQATPV